MCNCSAKHHDTCWDNEPNPYCSCCADTLENMERTNMKIVYTKARNLKASALDVGETFRFTDVDDDDKEVFMVCRSYGSEEKLYVSLETGEVSEFFNSNADVALLKTTLMVEEA